MSLSSGVSAAELSGLPGTGVSGAANGVVRTLIITDRRTVKSYARR